jgi:cobalt-zinc-cadmium efflux system membrane fusion protein
MKKYIILLSLLVFVFCGGKEKEISSHSHGQEGHIDEAQTPEVSKKEAPKQEQGVHMHQHEGEEHPDLHLSAQKQKDWGIVVGTAAKQDIASKITIPGVLALNQNKTAHISSFVKGKVISLSSDLGDRVKKKQVLVTINSPDFAQAQATFLQARAKLNLSRQDVERAKMLFQEKAIEQKEYLRREAEHAEHSTEYGAAESVLHSYGIEHEQIQDLIKKCDSLVETGELCELTDPNLSILSPVEGTVIFRDVTVGEHVEPQKILFTVSNLNTLWAHLDAYEKDLPYISKKSEVTIKSHLYPEKEFKGKIAYISDTIDEKLRTIKIRVEVKNDEGLLKPNMYIQGTVENKQAEKKILAIPEEAIQNINGEKIVFVLEEKDTFAVCHVELGEKIGNKRIIAKGLEEGEKIVIKGAFNLKAELTKASFGASHVH